MDDESFKLAIDSKQMIAWFYSDKAGGWNKFADAEVCDRSWRVANELQAELRSLDPKHNNLSASEVIANVMKRVNDEL